MGTALAPQCKTSLALLALVLQARIQVIFAAATTVSIRRATLTEPVEACLFLCGCDLAAPTRSILAHRQLGRRCTLPTQGLLELIQIMACLAPTSEPRLTRLALPRLLPVVDCITCATFAHAVAGPAEALELFVTPGSFMSTRT